MVRQEPVAPSEDPGKIGDKSAVKVEADRKGSKLNEAQELRKTLSGAKNAAAKAAARKKMAALEQQIKRDFDSVTSYAHKVKNSPTAPSARPLSFYLSPLPHSLLLSQEDGAGQDEPTANEGLEGSRMKCDTTRECLLVNFTCTRGGRDLVI